MKLNDPGGAHPRRPRRAPETTSAGTETTSARIETTSARTRDDLDAPRHLKKTGYAPRMVCADYDGRTGTVVPTVIDYTTKVKHTEAVEDAPVSTQPLISR